MHTPPTLRDPSLLISKGFVGGQHVGASNGATFEVKDPSTDKVIGTCADFSAEDGIKAIDAAAEAFKTFSKTVARDRARLLRKWYELMLQHAEDLTTLITWENGKPVPDAAGEVNFAASFLEWFSEAAVRIDGDTIPASVAGNRIITLKQPVGVCAMITPWNFPAAMITRKVGAALAAGCTTVIKPASETLFTANAVAELARRAGIPAGVINVVPACRHTREIGALLTTDQRIKKVSFTGSTGVGKLLMSQASSSMKKLSLELGGNAPFIVFDDCPDIDAAVQGAVNCKFRSSGQTCICANRIYVHRSIYDTFAQKLVARVRQFSVGHGFNKGVTHGPVVNAKAVDKVEQHVQDAVTKGARVEVGGQRLPELGACFYAPTVLTGVTADMLITQEETFGPVAPLIPFDTEKEVVALANAAEVGLAGYLFSRDIGRIYRVAEAIEVGMVGVNTGIISDPASPFGGVKESGFGREGSKYGIDEYLSIKSITVGGMQMELQG